MQNKVNAHVQPAHTKYEWLQKFYGALTVRTYYDDEMSVHMSTHTVHRSSRTRKSILWP